MFLSLIFKKSFIFFLGLIFLSIVKLSAYIEVSVTEMNSNPMPIVKFNFMTDIKSKWIGEILNNVITNDLYNSGAFSIFDECNPNTIDYNTDLHTTRSLLSNYMDFNALVIGKVMYQGGEYKISYILWDIYSDKPLLAKMFTLKDPNNNDINYLAHYIGNSIYKVFIGEVGFFNSKIAFINNHQVYIMDYDGKNKEPITNGDLEAYTPIFSYDNKYIAYIILNNGISEIYIYDIFKKVNCKLGNFSSLVLAPRFSRNSEYMLFAIANRGSTNIFKLNIHTKEVKQLTYSNSINIPGDFSPDSTQIVFTSDRRGKPQIYTMNSEGKDIKRISSLDGAYYTPKWSPRGDLISFTKILKGGDFSIGIMSNDGENEKIITKDYFAEGPYWSCNGRNLIYQFVYDPYNRFYGFNLVSLSNGFKILLKPFEDVKDPSFSSNFINQKVIQSEVNLN